MNKSSLATLCLAALMLSGCAASGPQYAAKPTTAATAQLAELVVFRPGEWMLGGRSARIKVDEADTQYVKRQGFISIDVAPGQHTLAADIIDAPGTCQLPITVDRGSVSYYEVQPRSSSMTAGLLFGVVGMAIESSGKDCGGAFSIARVEPDYATKILQSLHESD